NASLTNTGTISSINGQAILVDGANAELSLSDAGQIRGSISFTDPESASFAVTADRTTIIGFETLPGTIHSGSLQSVSYGSSVLVVDPDDFATNTDAPTFNALTREVSGTIEAQLEAGRLAPSGYTATNGTHESPAASGRRFWGTPFGGALSRSGNDGFDYTFGGAMAGADQVFSDGLRGGLTGGFSIGHTDSNNDVQSASSYSLFAGGYLTRNWGPTFADFSLVGGYLNSSEDVTVASTSAASGEDVISLDYNYLFASPTARIGHAFAAGNGVLTPSLRLRYSGLVQTGDARDGSTGLTVSDRALQVLELRGQAGYDFDPVAGMNGTWHLGFKAGVDGIFTLDDSLDGSLAGTALDLATSSDEAIVRGFAKANAVWQASNGMQVISSIEGGYDSADTLSASMRLGFTANF
ncbi:autotransporter outer membrane beta-barrel domain-containing protein, partial [Roseibium sp. RKSG952]|uniref:autotransporter outer membrane beta-barrel domain-containing protein n=1 Tax=Roseibium sp. RKSG952 TaxID=2529384 RepID=UPI0012BC58F2